MPTQLKSLEQQVAILKKVVRDKLGTGIWGLDKKENFTHEEIVFLFARVFPVFGIDFIKEIRTVYPDCICVKDGKEVAIEFEPLLSSCKDHVNNKELYKCQYIVCWKNDLPLHSSIQKEIDENNIQVLQLKEFYEANIVKDRIKPVVWTRKDMEKLKTNQLKVLSAFIEIDQEILTNDEIGNHIRIAGKTLGPVLSSFTKNQDWLIRKHHSGGWQFNMRYKQEVIDTLKKFPI
jgi:hypothetical protein